MPESPFHVLPFVLFLLTACGSGDEGAAASRPGSIGVRVYGESFIEHGIPAEEVNDGWSIAFDRFEVDVRALRVAGVEVNAEALAPLDVAVESDGEGHELVRVEVAAGRYREPSFTIARVEVEGLAERQGKQKSFHWTFTEPTHYSHCETTTTVEPGAHATFQITVHADHLFYDSLVAAEPQLRFDAMAAADSDSNGEVTRAELEARDLGDYDPGNEDVNDLWSWLVAQNRTLGHVDGEGHCAATGAN